MQLRAMMMIGMALIAAPAAVVAQDPPAVQEQRRMLNEAEANRAAAQIADYEARKQAVAEQQAAADANYRDAMARHDARIADMNARAAQARTQWETDVSLCQAGDRTRCAPVATPTPKPRATPRR
jgi:hypothetical protein